MAARRLFILILGALLIWCLSCNLTEVAFPVVVTGVPEEDESGRLEVDFIGTLELESMDDLDVIQEFGFAWSPENPLPDPTTDFTVEAILSQDTLKATLTDPLLNYEQDQYYVRAFIRIKDNNRDSYIVSQDRQRFSFNSKFSIVTGFPSIVQDRITTTSLIEYVDGFAELINDHGHIYSKSSGSTLESCTGPDCAFISLGDKLDDPSMFSTSIQGDYNTRYFITPVIDLDGQIIYGDEVDVVLTGGINRSTGYPFDMQVIPLYDGIAMSEGEFATKGYVGGGNALFEVTASDDDVHELVYNRMTDYPPELGSAEYRSGTGFVVSDHVCLYPGIREATQAIEGRIFCFSNSSETWKVFDPPASVSFAGRFEAVSFVIDDHAYIGFGRTGPGTSSFDFLDFCPTCPVDDQLRLFRPTPEFRVPQRGQVAAVIGNSAYITTGKGSGETQMELMKFTPDGANGEWENLMPLDAPEGRWNAFGFALDGNLYVGFGQSLEDGSIDTSDDIWLYEPSTNEWSEYDYETPTIAERSRAISLTLNGRGYFGSGQTSILSALTDMWVLTPNRIDP